VTELSILINYFRDETGASAAEYALILALIAAAIIGALTALGGQIANITGSVANSLGNATTAS
jgi:pilus assembly protein Flp/PilA